MNYNIPKYLSPSALGTYEASDRDYYLKYLALNRPPRFPQTEAMAVGSAFDAYVKAEIAERVWGRNEKEQFVLNTIFEKQVEPQNRDFAWGAGEKCYLAYLATGAFERLMNLVGKSDPEPQMEFTAGGVDEYGNPIGDIDGVTLLGKPDLVFFVGERKIIHDWKVNGYCSASNTSPVPGYRLITDSDIRMKSRGNGAAHKDYMPYYLDNFELSMVDHLEERKKDWATQLATYNWVTGSDVGAECIVMVDQLVCNSKGIRVAEHRCMVSTDFQKDIHARYRALWVRIHSGVFFDEEQCGFLNSQAAAFEDPFMRRLFGRG